MLAQPAAERASRTAPTRRLNLAIAKFLLLRSLPLRRGRLLLFFDLPRCFPSSTDRQSFVRDLPMSSYGDHTKWVFRTLSLNVGTRQNHAPPMGHDWSWHRFGKHLAAQAEYVNNR